MKTMTKKAWSTVASISIFGRFIVEDSRKRLKKCVFSNENTFVWTGNLVPRAFPFEIETWERGWWTGEPKTKALVWAKIYCFVFVEMEAGALEKQLTFNICCSCLQLSAWMERCKLHRVWSVPRMPSWHLQPAMEMWLYERLGWISLRSR